MSLLDDIARVREHLQKSGRISFRVLKREFDLDNEGLEDIIEELVDVQQVAIREDKILTWRSDAAATSGPPPASREMAKPAAYTPKHLAEKILQSRSALEGERKQVTVLFADVKGSMELARELDPEAWHQVLDGFFSILTGCIHQYEGTVNQYTGDGVMALFGAPIAHEDHAQRACYAALQTRDRLRDYGDEVRVQHGVSFGVRIGINSGDVVVGKIGDDLRMDYTAQGETVGIAQRIEQLAESGHAYMSESTEHIVRGYFQLRCIGETKLKGVEASTQIYELEDIGGALTRLDISKARGLTRFVGRANEMAVLDTALSSAHAGHGQVVGVVGDPGLGKSRLCYEFAERCRAQGVPVYEAHCPAHGKNVPFLPILELFRKYLGVTTQDSPAEARQKIAGALLLLDKDVHDALPVLFDFMGVTDPSAASLTMDAEARQRLLFSLVHRVTKARSERGETVVILIDDLHWIDPGSDLYVAQMVEAVEQAQNLLLLNFRPEYSAEWARKPHYQQLPLVPLGAEDVCELLVDLLGQDASLAELNDRVLEWTAGNPFYAEEVVQMLIETEVLTGQRGAYRLAKPLDQLEVPTSVRAILAARIDRLDSDAKRVLQHAAVIGKTFSAPVLAATLDVVPAELGSTIETLKRHEFVYEQQLYPVVEYAFKHPLSHEVAYDSQLSEHRRETHGKVARAIEQQEHERLDEYSALLAYHFEAAGDLRQAVFWYERAALWAGINDAHACYRHWQRVRELLKQLPEEPELTHLGARAAAAVLNLTWRIAASVEDCEQIFPEAARLAEKSGDKALLSVINMGYGAVCSLSGHAPDYFHYANEAWRLAQEIGEPRLQFAASLYASHSRVQIADFDESERIALEALAYAPNDPDFGAEFTLVSPRAALLHGLAWGCVVQGRFAEADRYFDDALALLQNSTYGDMPIWVYTLRPMGQILKGTAEVRRDEISNALSLAESLGTRMAESFSQLATGLMHFALGEWDLAVQSLRRSLDVSKKYSTAAQMRAQITAYLAESILESGRNEKAHAVALEAVECFKTTGFRWEARPWLALTRTSIAIGDRIAAKDALENFAQVVNETGAHAYDPYVHEWRAIFADTFDEYDWNPQEERQQALALYTELGATGHAERLQHEIR